MLCSLCVAVNWRLGKQLDELKPRLLAAVTETLGVPSTKPAYPCTQAR